MSFGYQVLGFGSGVAAAAGIDIEYLVVAGGGGGGYGSLGGGGGAGMGLHQAITPGTVEAQNGQASEYNYYHSHLLHFDCRE